MVRRFRTTLVALAAATCAGAMVELAMLRHWNGPLQLFPWLLLVVLAIAIGTHWLHPTRVTVLAARALAVVCILGSGFGMLEHILSNWEVAPLSARYATTWDTIPLWQQWWLAATGGAGIAPVLAPGFVALSGICLALSTMGSRERR